MSELPGSAAGLRDLATTLRARTAAARAVDRALRWGLVACVALVLGTVAWASVGRGNLVPPGAGFTVRDTTQTWANGQRVEAAAVRGAGEPEVELSVGRTSAVLGEGQTLWLAPWGGLTVHSIEPTAKKPGEDGPTVQVSVVYRAPVWFTGVAAATVVLGAVLLVRTVKARRSPLT